MKRLFLILKRKNLKLAVVESCTGGLLASSITSVSGASKVFSMGFVTYSNQSKINEDVGVTPHVIALQYANAEEVAELLKNVTENITIDPTGNKDKVALVEAQAEIAKNFILHTSSSVLNRIEWLRRHSKENKLTNQNIKFQFSNNMLSSLAKVIPVSSGQNVVNEGGCLPCRECGWSKCD